MQTQILNKDFCNLFKCTRLPYFVISRQPYIGKLFTTYYMMEITEEQENLIDRKRPIILNVPNKGKITIENNNIIFYGQIDISSTGEDYELLKNNKTIVNQEIFGGGKWLPSGYNYDTHTSLSDTKFLKIYQTWNAAEIVQYGHGCIGKPKRTIIFKIVSK